MQFNIKNINSQAPSTKFPLRICTIRFRVQWIAKTYFRILLVFFSLFVFGLKTNYFRVRFSIQKRFSTDRPFLGFTAAARRYVDDVSIYMSVCMITCMTRLRIYTNITYTYEWKKYIFSVVSNEYFLYSVHANSTTPLSIDGMT